MEVRIQNGSTNRAVLSARLKIGCVLRQAAPGGRVKCTPLRERTSPWSGASAAPWAGWEWDGAAQTAPKESKTVVLAMRVPPAGEWHPLSQLQPSLKAGSGGLVELQHSVVAELQISAATKLCVSTPVFLVDPRA